MFEGVVGQVDNDLLEGQGVGLDGGCVGGLGEADFDPTFLGGGGGEFGEGGFGEPELDEDQMAESIRRRVTDGGLGGEAAIDLVNLESRAGCRRPRRRGTARGDGR